MGRFLTGLRFWQFRRPSVKAAGGRAHLLGVVSDGGVHGSLAHMIAAAQALTGRGVAVDIHAITDGRDVPPTSALGFLATLQADLPGGARVASVVGRYYAMDRDNRWDRVEAAFDCIVRGTGAPAASAHGAVKAAYGRGETDEFIAPATLTGDPMVAGDGVFCLNFRADRARQIMAAIGDAKFDAFDRPDPPHLSAIMGMAEYSDRHRAYMTSRLSQAHADQYARGLGCGAWDRAVSAGRDREIPPRHLLSERWPRRPRAWRRPVHAAQPEGCDL